MIGKVANTSPLSISIGELFLDKEDLLISDILLGNYSRKASLTLSGSGSVGSESGAASLSGNGTITLNNSLQKGDLIAMVPTENRQKYIILCKVVKP